MELLYMAILLPHREENETKVSNNMNNCIVTYIIALSTISTLENYYSKYPSR